MKSLQFVVLGDPAKIDRRIFLQGGGLLDTLTNNLQRATNR
jgi:hypothetical protein